MSAMTFNKWREYKIKVMGEPPAWFSDPAECQRRFADYRNAFEGNCSSADPLDRRFAPSTFAIPPVPALRISQDRPRTDSKRLRVSDLFAPLTGALASAFAATAAAAADRFL